MVHQQANVLVKSAVLNGYAQIAILIWLVNLLAIYVY
jgi:hypothetical protein